MSCPVSQIEGKAPDSLRCSFIVMVRFGEDRTRPSPLSLWLILIEAGFDVGGTNITVRSSHIVNGDDCITINNGGANVYAVDMYCEGGHVSWGRAATRAWRCREGGVARGFALSFLMTVGCEYRVSRIRGIHRKRP